MGRILVTEADVRRAAACGAAIRVEPGAILTPGAQDAALALGVRVEDASPGRSTVDALRDRRVVAIGADHGGFEAKEDLRRHLESLGYLALDLGTHSADPVDYPDIAERVARAVAEGRASEGILVDGAGIGSAIAANKVRGVRAAKCDSLFDVRNSREHNHANVLSLGARIERGAMREMVRVWLETPFGGGRHERRVRKIEALERRLLPLLLLCLVLACDHRPPVRPPDPVRQVTPFRATDLPAASVVGGGWRLERPQDMEPSSYPAGAEAKILTAILGDYYPPGAEVPIQPRVYTFRRPGDCADVCRERVRHARFREGGPCRDVPAFGDYTYRGIAAETESLVIYCYRGPYLVEILVPQPDETKQEQGMRLLRCLSDILWARWPAPPPPPAPSAEAGR